jgi:hypothetical protein
MKKALPLSIVLILAASSVVGAVELGSAGPSPTSSLTSPKATLPPFQFQVNGRDPYTVSVPMTEGEVVSGEVNVTGGTIAFSIVLHAVTVQSETVYGIYHYQFTAAAAGTYDFVFVSQQPVLVVFSAYA